MNSDLFVRLDLRKKLTSNFETFIEFSFEEEKKKNSDSIASITSLIKLCKSFSIFDSDQLKEHKKYYKQSLEKLTNNELTITDVEFGEDKSVISISTILGQRVKQIDSVLHDFCGFKVKEEDKSMLDTFKKELMKLEVEKKHLKEVEKLMIEQMKKYWNTLKSIAKILKKQGDIKQSKVGKLKKLFSEMRNNVKEDKLGGNPFFKEHVFYFYCELVEKSIQKIETKPKFFKELTILSKYIQTIKTKKKMIDDMVKEILALYSSNENVDMNVIERYQEKIRDVLYLEIRNVVVESEKIEKSLENYSFMFYNEGLNYQDYFELMELFTQKMMEDFDSVYDKTMEILSFSKEFEMMKSFVFNSYFGSSDTKLIFTKGKEFFKKCIPITQFFRERIKKEKKILKLPIFQKTINEFLHDFDVLEMGYKAISVHKSRLTEIKEFINQRDKLNTVVKEIFIRENETIELDKRDLEDIETLKKVCVIIYDKLMSLKTEVDKISEKLGFDIPVKIEVERLTKFTFFGVKTKFIKKKNFLQKDKTVVKVSDFKSLFLTLSKYLGEMQYRNGKFYRHGIGKSYYDNSHINYYGRWQDDKKHGNGCEYTISKRGRVEGDWRKGRLLRRKIESIRLEKLNLEKYIKKINYQRDLIGYGGFSEVFKISVNGVVLAAKILRRNQTEIEDFEKECKILCSLNHENIVKFVSISFKPLGYLTEFCSRGSVAELIKNLEMKNVKKLPFERKFEIIYQTIKGVNYLHCCHIIHRDLKWANVLLNDKFVIKIIDFGLSKTIASYRLSAQNTARLGTSWYISPECFSGKIYSYPADVYSFSIMLYEIIFDTSKPYHLRKEAYLNADLHGAKASRDPNYRPVVFSSMINGENKYIVNIMQRCWLHEENERPTFDYLEEEFGKKAKAILQ